VLTTPASPARAAQVANGPSLAGGQPEGASGLALAWPQRVGARLASAAWRSPFSSPGAASFPRSKLTPEHQASWREWAGVNNHTRGGGWWRWKPYYLLRELRAVRQGDVMARRTAARSPARPRPR
jgi:hypothetical protein